MSNCTFIVKCMSIYVWLIIRLVFIIQIPFNLNNSNKYEQIEERSGE